MHEHVEHRLEIERGTAYNFEDVGGRSLLLQGFAQLVQQPGVLDGDDRLARKAPDELDLLVVERLDLLAVDGDRTDQLLLLKQRYGEHGPISAELDGLDGNWISVNVILQRRDVGNLGHLLRPSHTAKG